MNTQIVRHRRARAVPLAAAFLLVFGWHTLTFAEDTSVPCHPSTPSLQPPKGYGAPVSFFSGSGTTTMRAACRDGSVSVDIGVPNGSMLVYKYAYHRTADNTRERIALTGARPYGDWFLGNAEGVIPHPRESSQFYAYLCEYVGGTWRCGCRDAACESPRWQVQTYTRPQNGDTGAQACPLPRITRVEPSVLAYNKPFRITGEHFETGTATVMTMYTKVEGVHSNGKGTELKLSYEPAFMRATLAEITPVKTYTEDMRAIMRDYTEKPQVETATIVENRVTKSPNWIIVQTPCGASEPFWLESELPSAING